MIRHPRAALGLLAVLALTGPGCGEDPAVPQPEEFAVTVVDVDSGEPINGVEIVPVDAFSIRPLADPQSTDADGRVRWPWAATADTRLLVFGAGSWLIAQQGDWWLGYGFRKTGPAPPAPPREVRIELARAIAGDGLPRMSGRIVDGETGEPLARVFVGDRPWLTAYLGFTGPVADVTGPDGRFSVGEVPVTIDPVTEELTQVSPLVVTREGYRPRAWLHLFAPGEDNIDVTGIEIALTPLGSGDDGVLTGRVFDDAGPAFHVFVGLGGIGADKTGFGIPGQVAVTDRAGRYTFTGLASGQYVVQPGFLHQDGTLLPGQVGARGYAVTAGDTTEVDDLLVIAEIVIPTDPAAGVPEFAQSAPFVWAPVPGDPTYVLRLGGVEIARTSATAFNWEFPTALPPGRHELRITALVGERIVGAMERPWVFRKLP